MSTIRAVATQNAKESSYDASRFNAVKHGVLSKFTVLPWESQDEYDALHAAFVEEHRPLGPTEEHLVEELAGIVWRKRRLRLAESATFRRGLQDAIRGTVFDLDIKYPKCPIETALVCVDQSPLGSSAKISNVIHGDTDDLADEARSVLAALKRAKDVATVLQDGEERAYERALTILHGEGRERWEAMVEFWAKSSNPKYTATADSLVNWIELEAQPRFQTRLVALNNRDAIKEQVLGDSFEAPRLESLARYETHLDRKLERTLAMLVKLQELRRQKETDEPATGESQ